MQPEIRNLIRSLGLKLLPLSESLNVTSVLLHDWINDTKPIPEEKEAELRNIILTLHLGNKDKHYVHSNLSSDLEIKDIVSSDLIPNKGVIPFYDPNDEENKAITFSNFKKVIEKSQLSFPNTIKNILSDHDLAAHSNLGLFSKNSEIDHRSISYRGSKSHAQIDTHLALVNEHIDWTNATENLKTTGTGEFKTILKINATVSGNPRLAFFQNGTERGAWQWVHAGQYLRLILGGLVGIIQKGVQVAIGGAIPTSLFDVMTPAGDNLGATAGDFILFAGMGAHVNNDTRNRFYMVRNEDGSDWTTASLHDACSVGTSFSTPGTNTKTWWERDIQGGIHSWGNAAATYMTLNSSELILPNDLIFVGSGSGLPYGEIYVNDNTTVTSVSSAGFTQFLYFDTNGHTNLSTPDHTNDHITITKAGVYMVDCCVNIRNSSGAAHDIEVVIAKNNNAFIFPNMRRHRTLGTGSDIGAIPICGHLGLEINDTIEVWITSDSGAARDVTAEDVVLMITMVGGV